MTADEVAERLNVNKRTVYRWHEDGTLPGTRIGRLIRFKVADVEALIEGGGADG